MKSKPLLLIFLMVAACVGLAAFYVLVLQPQPKPRRQAISHASTAKAATSATATDMSTSMPPIPTAPDTGPGLTSTMPSIPSSPSPNDTPTGSKADTLAQAASDPAQPVSADTNAAKPSEAAANSDPFASVDAASTKDPKEDDSTNASIAAPSAPAPATPAPQAANGSLWDGLVSTVQRFGERLGILEEKVKRLEPLEGRVSRIEHILKSRHPSMQTVSDRRAEPGAAGGKTSDEAGTNARFHLVPQPFQRDRSAIVSTLHFTDPGAPSIEFERRASNSWVLRVNDAMLAEKMPWAPGPLAQARVTFGSGYREIIYTATRGTLSGEAHVGDGEIVVRLHVSGDGEVAKGNDRIPSPSVALSQKPSVYPATATAAMFRVRAITPTSAVLIRVDNSAMLAVTDGTIVPGCGMVTSLNPNSVQVGTECGSITR